MSITSIHDLVKLLLLLCLVFNLFINKKIEKINPAIS